MTKRLELFSGQLKRDRRLRRLKRNITFSKLPTNWSIRKRIELAVVVADTSKNAWKEYAGQTESKRLYDAALVINKAFARYSSVISSLDELLSQAPMVGHEITLKAEEVGLSLDQLNLSLNVLQMVADTPPMELKPRESVNKKTDYRRHDLAVGKQLIVAGLSRKKAARILAEIRKEDPFAGVYSAAPKVIDDIEKECLAIEQCLRNEGL